MNITGNQYIDNDIWKMVRVMYISQCRKIHNNTITKKKIQKSIKRMRKVASEKELIENKIDTIRNRYSCDSISLFKDLGLLDMFSDRALPQTIVLQYINEITPKINFCGVPLLEILFSDDMYRIVARIMQMQVK